jgi:hypothetical protein
LTGITKYGVLVSGIQTGFSMILAIAIYPMLITKSLKRPYFVTAYNGDFVQCVSPKTLSVATRRQAQRQKSFSQQAVVRSRR